MMQIKITDLIYWILIICIPLSIILSFFAVATEGNNNVVNFAFNFDSTFFFSMFLAFVILYPIMFLALYLLIYVILKLMRNIIKD